MISEIEQHRREIEALCREYGVERLALFGSAASGGFRANSSDLDFLVEFRTPLAPGYADRYFGLLVTVRFACSRLEHHIEPRPAMLGPFRPWNEYAKLRLTRDVYSRSGIIT
jgi:predicted nucleotidyltransferase